jgi:hypothetical protein
VIASQVKVPLAPAADLTTSETSQNPQPTDNADSSQSVSPASSSSGADAQNPSAPACDAAVADGSPTTNSAVNVERSFGPIFGAHLPLSSSNQPPVNMSAMRFGQALNKQTGCSVPACPSTAASTSAETAADAGTLTGVSETSSQLLPVPETAVGAVTSSGEMEVDDDEDGDE